MIRLFAGDRLVVASHNQGKLREIIELLAPFGIKAVSASERGLPEPEETGSSFADNATLKAEAAAKGAGLPALADDSGLCVPALDNAPGIYSARWAGPSKDFRIAMRRVEEELRDTESHDMRAFFVCALALAAPGATTQAFEGRVYGSLAFPPRGDKGFGYDPIFVPEGYRMTFGEMSPADKHAMSHRARAFAKFVAAAIAPGTEQ
ncbi:MAG TPA: RdgB/HAM1 family non-canonical purine NTP pyrophosphatase [Micropepsaceae bacterium]|nr:RdgB/HAM1 family non-canonical purine NTP pyrophosphatase [Micropepsaceae bacterium]